MCLWVAIAAGIIPSSNSREQGDKDRDRGQEELSTLLFVACPWTRGKRKIITMMIIIKGVGINATNVRPCLFFFLLLISKKVQVRPKKEISFFSPPPTKKKKSLGTGSFKGLKTNKNGPLTFFFFFFF